MFKKILIIIGYILLTAAIVAYFVFSTMLVSNKKNAVEIKSINITIKDSAVNGFVNKDMIRSVLQLEGLNENESLIKHINQFEIERQLKKRFNIKTAQVYSNLRGEMSVEIEQRRPLLRLEGEIGGFYLDEEEYIFPIDSTYTANVPIVTGYIPYKLFQNFRGYAKKEKVWARSILEIGQYIAKNEFWNSMIEQIDVDEKEILYFTPRVGEQEIRFGSADNIHLKFSKLYTFYKDIVPNSGWDKYKSVDLDIDNQIICRQRSNKAQIKDTTLLIK